jgi:hypothetical protein
MYLVANMDMSIYLSVLKIDNSMMEKLQWENKINTRGVKKLNIDFGENNFAANNYIAGN